MEVENAAPAPFSPSARDIIPIADLDHRRSIPNDKSIRAVVSLIWPFSSSTQTTAILAVEPDFRLRTKKGQVRIQFKGPAAKALATSRIANGDVISLALEGAQFADDAGAATVRTPGRSVDIELVYTLKLELVIERDGEPLRSLSIDEPISAFVIPNATPSRPIPLPSLTPRQSPPLRPSQVDAWSSPAFETPLRFPTSQAGLFKKDYTGEDWYLQDRDPKRLKVWKRGVDWHMDSDVFVDGSPSQPRKWSSSIMPAAAASIIPKFPVGNDDPANVPPLEAPKAPASSKTLPIQSTGQPLISTSALPASQPQDAPIEIEPTQDPPELVSEFFLFEEFGNGTPPNVTFADQGDLYTASPRPNVEDVQQSQDLVDFSLLETTPPERHVAEQDLMLSKKQNHELHVEMKSRDGEIVEELYESKLVEEMPSNTPVVIDITDLESSPGQKVDDVGVMDAVEQDQSYKRLDFASATDQTYLNDNLQPQHILNTELAGDSPTYLEFNRKTNQYQPYPTFTSEAQGLSQEQVSHLHWLLDDYSGSGRNLPTPQASQVTVNASQESNLASQENVPQHHFKMPPTPLLTQEPSRVSIPDSTTALHEPPKAASPKAENLQTPKVSSRRKSDVPDVISPWFTSKAQNRNLSGVGVHDTIVEREKVQSSHDSLQVIRDETTDPVLHDESIIIGSKTILSHNGLRTALSYYTPLSVLENYLNSPKSPYGSVVIDVFAVLEEDATKPSRADKGPKDFFTTLKVFDMSSYPNETQVQIFRPWSAALPDGSAGDVILLRNFVVQTASKNRVFLLSAESSAWCVWHFSKQKEHSNKPVWARQAARLESEVEEECKGPPVELGEGERRHARVLASWWVKLPQKSLDGSGDAESLRDSMKLPLSHIGEILGRPEVSVN